MAQSAASHTSCTSEYMSWLIYASTADQFIALPAARSFGQKAASRPVQCTLEVSATSVTVTRPDYSLTYPPRLYHQQQTNRAEPSPIEPNPTQHYSTRGNLHLICCRRQRMFRGDFSVISRRSCFRDIYCARDGSATSLLSTSPLGL